MKQTKITLPEIKLMGITARTNNEAEMNLPKARIGALLAQYHGDSIPKKTPNRLTPNKGFCAYTNYDSNEDGDYTFFIGEEVDEFSNTSPDLTSLTIPNQSYIRFTTEAGPMPQIVIQAWQKIWGMTSEDLGGERSYITDFEVYDERAADLTNAVVDIYIGLK